MQDITPIIGKEKKVITSYGAGGFKINDQKVESSLFFLPDEFKNLELDKLSEISRNTDLQKSLIDIIGENQNEISILLVGAGASIDFFDSVLEAQIKSYSISIEYMDTGAACRTYNILLSEERKVAALLIKV